MNGLSLSRGSLSVCAATLFFAGCGGSQALIGQSATAQQPIAKQVGQGLTAATSSVEPLLSLAGETFTTDDVQRTDVCSKLYGKYIKFQAKGKATGPVVGRFIASGEAGLIGSFSEEFEIISGSHRIHGDAEAKRLISLNACKPKGTFDAAATYVQDHYRRDQGRARVTLHERSFSEVFR